MDGTDVDTFRPRVANPKVIMVGRRYSLVHRPGSYLINDTKDPSAPAELFQVGERSQALLRYRQLEAHSTSARLHLAKGQAGTWVRRTGRSVRGTLPHRHARGVRARRWNVAARSWAARMVPERPGRAFVPIAAVVSVGVLVAIMLIADPFQPETAAPEFSLGVNEAAAPTITEGSGDPPRAELGARVDETSPPPAAPDEAGHRHDGGGGGDASGSGSSAGSSIVASESSTVTSTGSGGSSSDGGGSSSGDSGSGGSTDSGSVDQGSGGSSDGSGSGPGGAGPGGGSTSGGGGTGSGGGGGGGGGG